MEIVKHIQDINNLLKTYRTKRLTIGFVPTMGALHEGHVSMIRKARNENDIVVCSIFVNPIQFNNKEDLEKYPRNLERDIEILSKNSCDILFYPDVEEMYPEEVQTKYDFGYLDKILEGEYRPGHFNGVAVVVKKLFDIIEPDKAYFGEKDFQQLVIIKKLVNDFTIPVKIIPCPIIRENDGLAMSSRNMRLTPDERKIAPAIYQLLMRSKGKAKTLSVEHLKKWIADEIKKFPFILEYFEIADSVTLKPIIKWEESENPIALIAVYLGKIRLIDNMFLKDE